MNLFSRFIRDESGATAIEYGLIAALVAVVIITGLTAVGTKLSTTLNERVRPAKVRSAKLSGTAAPIGGGRSSFWASPS